MYIETKRHKYNVKSFFTNKNQDDYSCISNCRRCMRCEIGFVNRELVGGF